MSMGKNSRGILAKLATVSAPQPYKEPEQSPEMTIKQSGNGGYIVTMMGKTGYSSRKEHTYETLDKVMECAEKHFGKAGKSEAGEAKDEA